MPTAKTLPQRPLAVQGLPRVFYKRVPIPGLTAEVDCRSKRSRSLCDLLFCLCLGKSLLPRQPLKKKVLKRTQNQNKKYISENYDGRESPAFLSIQVGGDASRHFLNFYRIAQCFYIDHCIMTLPYGMIVWPLYIFFSTDAFGILLACLPGRLPSHF